ncbi:RNA-directed DNA polymerase, eukaryota, partial [Tanacetum coccineum]
PEKKIPSLTLMDWVKFLISVEVCLCRVVYLNYIGQTGLLRPLLGTNFQLPRTSFALSGTKNDLAHNQVCLGFLSWELLAHIAEYFNLWTVFLRYHIDYNVELYCKSGLSFVMGTTGGDRDLLYKTVQLAYLYAMIYPQTGKQVVAFLAATDIMSKQFLAAFSGYTLELQQRYRDGDESGIHSCFRSAWYVIWFSELFSMVLRLGVIFGSPIALAIGTKFVPLRKPNKLPESDGVFSVASIRKEIDGNRFQDVSLPTRWVKSVPIKVNIIAWKVKSNALPTRFNISRRGMDIDSIVCPICNAGVESTNHIFFQCVVVRQIMRNDIFLVEYRLFGM